jgi:5-methylcytosine-specific restriction protein A
MANWKQDKRTRHERGYGSAWVRLRKQILDRDYHLCQHCKAKGRVTPAFEVHHIKRKADGGSDDPSNLVSICHACHESAHGAREDSKRLKFDATGQPIWG